MLSLRSYRFLFLFGGTRFFCCSVFTSETNVYS